VCVLYAAGTVNRAVIYTPCLISVDDINICSGGTYANNFGVISSPTENTAYPPDKRCQIALNATRGTVVTFIMNISLTDPGTECSNSYINIKCATKLCNNGQSGGSTAYQYTTPGSYYSENTPSKRSLLVAFSRGRQQYPGDFKMEYYGELFCIEPYKHRV